MTEFRPSAPSDIPALRELWKEAFGDPDEYLDIFFPAAYAPQRSRAVYREGEIIGGAYWLDCFLGERKLAYVYAVAIRASCQGQGLGSRLMEEIHRTLTEQGYAGVLLVPGDEGLRRYYSRFGYRTVSYRGEYTPKAGLPVTAEHYARLRRRRLPENGVIQEGENLRLLEALANFYRGENCVYALSRLDGRCLELLGGEGPAEKKPYAMAKDLTAEPLPEEIYFAFGFD